MNVTRLRLSNFKRFTDLTIDLSSCAGAPKLVLLIGANGSGKSSVFDAFEYLSAPHKESSSGLDLGELVLRTGKSGPEYSRYLKKDPGADVSLLLFRRRFRDPWIERLTGNHIAAEMGREVRILRSKLSADDSRTARRAQDRRSRRHRP